MADKKEIKRRIKSIRNIGQITKALQMVSAVKMRKAQQALLSSTPYFEQMEEIFNTMLLDIGKNEIAELFATKGNKKKSNIALIMISPSKGFAGPLISNLTKKTVEFIEKRNSDTPYTNGEFLIFHEKEHNITHNQAAEEEKVDIKLVTIEKKSRDFAVKIHKEVIADFPQLSNPPIFHDILPLSNIVIDGYKDGSIQEVFVVYTHFINTFIQKAVIKKLLPFDLDRVYETLKGHDTAEH